MKSVLRMFVSCLRIKGDLGFGAGNMIQGTLLNMTFHWCIIWYNNFRKKLDFLQNWLKFWKRWNSRKIVMKCIVNLNYTRYGADKVYSQKKVSVIILGCGITTRILRYRKVLKVTTPENVDPLKVSRPSFLIILNTPDMRISPIWR